MVTGRQPTATQIVAMNILQMITILNLYCQRMNSDIEFESFQPILTIALLPFLRGERS